MVGDASTSAAAAAAPNGDVALTGRLASAASIAGPFQSAIAEAIKARRDAGKQVPKLVGILATPSPPSVAYAQWTKKACEQVGIQFEIWQTWSDEQKESKTDDAMEGVEGAKDVRADADLEADVEDLIIAANADDTVHGVMVYYPIFGGRQDTYLQQIVDPRKDVEGLHFSYCFNMYHNIRWIDPSQVGGAPGTTIEASAGAADNEASIAPGFAKSILPCTPLAVVKCLEGLGVYDGSLPYGDRLFGKTITVINRSEVVGRPLAALLSNDGAKVFSVDVDSVQEFNKRAAHDSAHKSSKIVQIARQRNASHRLRPHHVVRQCSLSLEECLKTSDVVISGVPSASFKIDTAWIKEGAVTVNFSSEKNFEKDVRARASIHLPAIGKTTIAMLQRNLLRLVDYRELINRLPAEQRQHRSHEDGNDGNAAGKPNGHGRGADEPSVNGAGASEQSNTHGESQSRSDGGAQENGATDNDDALETTDMESSREVPMLDVKQGSQSDHRRPSTAGPLPAPPTWPQSSNVVPSLQRHAPSYMRERSGTMTNPVRNAPLSHVSPPYPIRRISHAGNSQTTGAWDWRSPAGRHDSISSVYTPNTAPGQTPPFGSSASLRPTSTGSQQPPQSPLLFAPISSSRPVSSSGVRPLSPYGPSRGQYTGNNQSNASFHSASSPRSATPVSPLIIDGLSVEDTGSTNTAGPGSQRQSWDSGPPRTPNDINDAVLAHSAPAKQQQSSGSASTMPSVLVQPEREDAEGRRHSAQQQAPPHPHHNLHHHQQQHGYQPDHLPHLQQHPHGQHMIYSPVDEKMSLDHDHRRAAGMPPHAIAQHQMYPIHAHHDAYSTSPDQAPDGQTLTSQLPPANQAGRMFPQDRIAHSRRRRRPPFSYSSLIAQAIASSPEGRMTLREIYTWISNAYPDLYSMEGSEGSGWQNTVRHNLSLNKAFVKVARTAQDIYDSCSSGVASMSQQARGKGGWWMLDPNVNPATIGATTKNEEEELDGVRVLRRRRTNSTSTSVVSEDDATSPTNGVAPTLHATPVVPSLTPSVLQQRGRSFTTSAASTPVDNMHAAAAAHAVPAMPSVLRGARARSDERVLSKEDEEQHQHAHQQRQFAPPQGHAPMSATAVGPVGARLIAGRNRPRGYTTNSADMHARPFVPPAMPLHNSPRGVPVAVGADASPISPYGYAPSLPSPGMYAHPLSPYTPSQGPMQLSGGGGGGQRNVSSPSSSTTRSSMTSNPPTPAQHTTALLSTSSYPSSVNSPQKRKLRFGEPGLHVQTGVGAPPPPAFYPRGGNVAEDNAPPPSSLPSGATTTKSPSGMPAQLARTSMMAPSPLSGRAILPPASAAATMNKTASGDEETVVRQRGAAAAAHVRGATIESDEANGSRMSITGLLNA